MKNKILKYFTRLGFILALFATQLMAQDFVHLKDGSVVECTITEISDFILYAEVYNEPYLQTYFSDDVDFLKIDPRNSIIIRQLKRGVRDAMEYADPLGENAVFGFYFGMSSEALLRNKTKENLYRTDSLGQPILVPYDPMDTEFKNRVKSLAKSLGGSSLAWILGM